MQSLASLQNLVATNDWLALWPELALALLALLLLPLDLMAGPHRRNALARVAFVAQVVVLAGVVAQISASESVLADRVLFSGMIRLTLLTDLMRVFFLVSSILVCHLASIYLSKQDVLPRVEYYHIALIMTAAMMLLTESNHFVMLFVSLETVTIGFFVLVAYCRNSPFSLEAGLKYLIMGGLSSALLLAGVVLLYGTAGNPTLLASTREAMEFGPLASFIEVNPDLLLVRVGVVLVLAGVAFKIAAVPFQIWVPDVYQGAPTPTTAFLAVASKAAGFIVLFTLCDGPFQRLVEPLILPLLTAMAMATILFGNLAALGQRNVKRLMGLSGVAHAGYLLLGVVAALTGTVDWAVSAVLFYLFTYLLASFAVFGVMAHVAGPHDEDQEIEHYQELAKENPFLSSVLAVGLGSLAGIPPLAGFIAKLLLFIAAYKAGLYWLLGVAIFGVVLSIYYYFGWMREAFFRVWRVPEEKVTTASTESAISRIPKTLTIGQRVTLGTLAVLTVLLGLYQGFLGEMLF